MCYDWCPQFWVSPFWLEAVLLPSTGQRREVWQVMGPISRWPSSYFQCNFLKACETSTFSVGVSHKLQWHQKKVLSLHWEVSTEHWWVQVTGCIQMFFFFFWIWFYPAAKSVLDTAHIPLSPHSWCLLVTRVQPLIYLLLTLAFTKCLLKKETDTQPCRCL